MLSDAPEIANSISDFITAWSLSGPQSVIAAFVAVLYLVGLTRLQLRSRWHAVPIRQMLYAIMGFTIIIFALAGPPEAFADDMFFSHMMQHILIAMVASVLLLAAKPMPCYIWAMPETIRIGIAPALAEQGWIRKINAVLVNPRVALPLFILTLWTWHIPELYQSAIQHEPVHFAMHISMFATSILFWWPIIGPPPVGSSLSEPQKIIYLILVVTPTAVLAAIITLSNSVLYTHYIDTPYHFTLTPTEDQRIGGLLMWIPGNIIYLATLTTLFFRWFAIEERKQRRSYRVPSTHMEATKRRAKELQKKSDTD